MEKQTCFNHGQAHLESREWKPEREPDCGVSVNNEVINFNKSFFFFFFLQDSVGNNQLTDLRFSRRLSSSVCVHLSLHKDSLGWIGFGRDIQFSHCNEPNLTAVCQWNFDTTMELYMNSKELTTDLFAKSSELGFIIYNPLFSYLLV